MTPLILSLVFLCHRELRWGSPIQVLILSGFANDQSPMANDLYLMILIVLHLYIMDFIDNIPQA